MRNPLMKRLPREAAKDASKYLAIFVMMVLLISICSGMRVGNESLKAAYYESFEHYGIEDGHITFNREIPEELKEEIEEKAGIRLYENGYFEADMETGATVRVYRQTDVCNQPCLLEGELPAGADEIALDRVFAKNNALQTGDTICLGGRDLKISGLIALVNYSTLFEKNTDSMFDSINFSIAVMTKEGFVETAGKNVYANYAWVYDTPYTDDTVAAELSEELSDTLSELLTEYAAGHAPEDMVSVEDYLPRYLNQAVTFAIEDIGGDEAGTMILCYMMIGILAFIFAVTISNTVIEEAGVIGTLRASGYTRGEIIRHYLALPVIVTLLAAAVGNLLGYTVLKDYCVGLYQASYSLTTYRTLWNPSAFLLSTVVPVVLMLVINLTVLTGKLALSPIRFLRHDLKKHKNRRAVRLSRRLPFQTRFRLRILFTNLPGYVVMIVGILFGAVLISFGDMLPRMLEEYRTVIVEDMISSYQYVLYDYRSAAPVTDDSAEKYASASFEYTKEGFLTDSVTVYGIVENSSYIPAEIPEGKALISTGIAKKFGLEDKDTIRLDEKYKRDVSYEIEIAGSYDYQSAMAIFMNIEDFRELFGREEQAYTGYFSDRRLTELSEEDVAAVITAEDYTKLSDQLAVSMGGMMKLIEWFGAIFFIVVVYVLCKQVIERNFQSIALAKILGFRDRELGAFYILPAGIAVLAGLFVSIPFVSICMQLIFEKYLYTMMSGYLPCNIGVETYLVTVLTGLVCFAVVALLQLWRVSRVKKSEALKDVE